MKRARTGRCAGLEFGILKQNAAASSVQAMLGKVTSSRARRPKVSMVGTAGQAKLCDVSHYANKWVLPSEFLHKIYQSEPPRKK